MSVFPSTLAIQVTTLPSGEKQPPLISHLSRVNQVIFFVATFNRPTFSYPFPAFDLISKCLPSGEKSLAEKRLSPVWGVSRVLCPAATSATKTFESVPFACVCV